MLKLLKLRAQTTESESNKSDNHSLSFEIDNSLAGKYVDKYFWIGRQVSLANLYQPLNTLINVLFFAWVPQLSYLNVNRLGYVLPQLFFLKKMLTSSFDDLWLIQPFLGFQRMPLQLLSIPQASASHSFLREALHECWAPSTHWPMLPEHCVLLSSKATFRIINIAMLNNLLNACLQCAWCTQVLDDHLFVNWQTACL